MATNLELAKALADFADALAKYNHLPPIVLASMRTTGTVYARVSFHDADDTIIRHLAVWADVFNTPVTFDPNGRGLATASITVEIGGRPVELSAALTQAGLREFGLKYSLPQIAAGELTEVPADWLLASLPVEAVA